MLCVAASQALDHGDARRRVVRLEAADHVQINVARGIGCCWLAKRFKSLRRAAGRPVTRPLSPQIERVVVVALWKRFGRTHDPRVDELRRYVSNLRILLVPRHDDSNTMFAREGNECIVTK